MLSDYFVNSFSKKQTKDLYYPFNKRVYDKNIYFK